MNVIGMELLTKKELKKSQNEKEDLEFKKYLKLQMTPRSDLHLQSDHFFIIRQRHIDQETKRRDILSIKDFESKIQSKIMAYQDNHRVASIKVERYEEKYDGVLRTELVAYLHLSKKEGCL